jgi:ketosteroid isomerase-like protein
MKHITILLAGLVAFATPVAAADNPAVTAQILALVKAQNDATVGGKPVSERLANASDDYTLFNGVWPVRLSGKSAVLAANTAGLQSGSAPIDVQIVDPVVQTYGDTAVLTYYGASSVKQKDGKLEAMTSKITRVYVKQGGRWQNVHSHLSPVK